MPFTPTHTLFALIFLKVRSSIFTKALIIGCIIPDFPMFIAVSSYHYSHSILGLFTYCLIAGLLVFNLWEFFIAKYLSLKTLDQKRDSFSWKSLSKVEYWFLISGIILGASSHLIWDSFSHSHGYMVQLMPLLNEAILGIPAFKAIQYGSTFVGLPFLIYFTLNQVERQVFIPKLKLIKNSFFNLKSFWVVTLICQANLFLYLVLCESKTIYQVIGAQIKSSIGIFILILLVYSIFNHFRTTSPSND